MANDKDYVFGLDIGTRNVVGTVGYNDDNGFHVSGQYSEEHDSRSMIDGQIHDIARVAKTVESVKKALEDKLKMQLEDVCIAAAGRVLRTITTKVEYEYPEESVVTGEDLNNLDLSEDIHNKILYEISKYEAMPNTSPELSIVKNYIDYMLDLPWNVYTKDIEDFKVIKDNLNKSHYDLEIVKERIIEYLAVKKNTNLINSPIICLVGPPGVGKTTLALSIAESMGRNFTKISLGGVDDEAIIKGHIRTYLGATPGKIMDGIKRAKSSNPVFLIDEIDKMSSNYKGDPASALLEVLDSTQNKHFKDNYIEEEYDLSNVLFITTANNIDQISPELKDRLEIINIDGYTEIEKIHIVKDYLIPKICKNHGINNIKISDDKILEIIRYYTRESGIRELERLISKIVRKIVTNKVIYKKRINTK